MVTLAEIFRLLIYKLRHVFNRVARRVMRRDKLLVGSERKFRALLEAAPDSVVIVDWHGHITLVNAEAERTFGYRAGEIVGHAVTELIPPRFHAQHREAFRRYLAAPGLRTMGAERELFGRRKDGSEFPIELSLSPLETDEGLLVTSAIRDVTARRAIDVELAAHRNELERLVAERTTALTATTRELEAFAYAVSHDLRAPLRSISGFSQILLEEHAERLDPEGREHLLRVSAASQRMGRLIDDLLGLSRLTRRRMGREDVSLSALAESVLAELHDRDPERVVRSHVQPGVAAVGDEGLLRVVLTNLIGNAWKFTSKREHAEISFTNGDGVYRVSDNGAGFDMAHAEKLFGAFQRLHSSAEFEGTGIGLATVQRVVNRHGGRIWAESSPGAGARFLFTLKPEGKVDDDD